MRRNVWASPSIGPQERCQAIHEDDGHPCDRPADLDGDFGAALFRLAYRLTGTRQNAEDVVHDVFAGLPEALRRYEDRGSLEGWLKRVTARVALMRLRTRKRRRETVLDDAPEPAVNQSATLDQIALREAVAGLPDALRVVLVLKEIEGYSHAEIAGFLGISVVTSRVRLMRAMRRLPAPEPPAGSRCSPCFRWDRGGEAVSTFIGRGGGRGR